MFKSCFPTERFPSSHPDARLPLGMKARILLVLALQLGCGASESAVEECEALGLALCSAIQGCAVVHSSSAVEQCLINFGHAVACEDAARVSETYDECMAQLESRVCPENPFLLIGSTEALPVACIGAIELQ